VNVLNLDPILSRREEIQSAAMASLSRRQAVSRIAMTVCVVCLGIALVPLVLLLVFVVAKGIPAWSFAFFTHLPRPAGIPGGGISNAIVGSLVIDGIAAAAAIPFGLFVALALAESNGRVASGIRFSADVLAGIPSITIGIFAFTLIVTTTGHFSAIAASFALAILMLPVIIRACENALRTVPASLLEAGLSLGGRRLTVARRVIIPAALPGIITGMLLAIARAAGETAPLLFTAIGNQFSSLNPFGPMNAMPLVVYLNGIQAYPDLQRDAWGTALFLLLLVLVLSVGGRFVAAQLRKSRA
jgi:phosphate transport system permease protein